MALNHIQSNQFVLKYSLQGIEDYAITLSNDLGDKLVIGYDKSKNAYYIDRTKSGITDFNPEFAKTAFAPRLTRAPKSQVKLVVDASSIELFADKGLSVLTSLFFPHKPYNHLVFKSEKDVIFEDITLIPLKSIW
ncbi:levanase precursor [mine drainage metagenome]|uniref:Levanase n=1 Tax=mine drainage metagenome TaxID=410659 RepID=A0A1J5P816_9ZZZZ